MPQQLCTISHVSAIETGKIFHVYVTYYVFYDNIQISDKKQCYVVYPFDSLFREYSSFQLHNCMVLLGTYPDKPEKNVQFRCY